MAGYPQMIIGREWWWGIRCLFRGPTRTAVTSRDHVYENYTLTPRSESNKVKKKKELNGTTGESVIGVWISVLNAAPEKG